ncbi:uncharacterized protein RCC_12314 [Ramularia collo-cygni]|uniref:RING-type E3 ubiquitin transferase n=1 Tax=Ramularia collo-cygni TaxID=112498 RepID=A0A2D3UQ66_9PEZI|nr:uncharacterized protein RCC_12314 [Ramularia collo-cygni]CZT15265.1 uncharacterized protein RCC_12314 [Ramularia collo-cygni]
MDGHASTGKRIAQDEEFKIKGAATRIVSDRSNRGAETCTICLESISERAVATPCNHLTFDFLCLVSWLQERSTCPLCKAEVKEVQYDWRSANDYKTYHVPKATVPSAPSQAQYARNVRRAHRPSVVIEDQSIERRRHVYRHRLYSLHVGSNCLSGYKDFSPDDYTRSPELQSRTRTFLRRELQVFTFLGNRDFLIEYIIAVLKKYHVKSADGRAEELLREFLGEANSKLLLHELQMWLRSSLPTLRAWDAKTQYRDSSCQVNKSAS